MFLNVSSLYYSWNLWFFDCSSTSYRQIPPQWESPRLFTHQKLHVKHHLHKLTEAPSYLVGFVTFLSFWGPISVWKHTICEHDKYKSIMDSQKRCVFIGLGHLLLLTSINIGVKIHLKTMLPFLNCVALLAWNMIISWATNTKGCTKQAILDPYMSYILRIQTF